MFADNKYRAITGAYYLEETPTCSPLEANWLTRKYQKEILKYLCEACAFFPLVHPVQPHGFHLVNLTNNTIFTGPNWLELAAEEWEVLGR